VKLLFDQNISFRIISKIINIFPEAAQVRQLNIENYSDIEIWDFAKNNDYTIITFDADFFDISSIKGHPPKIIWLRFGNTTTNYLAGIINSKKDIITDFISEQEYQEFACLEIK
jgi:predicted nuclease of predicted toxin-antitoxin system